MADKILQWKARRALIDSRRQVPADDLRQAGLSLLEGGYLSEALDFLGKAGDQGAIRELASRAVEEGDFFLYSLARQSLGEPPVPKELFLLAENARRLGLSSYERKALDLLGEAGEA
jgi:hypothetical protein